MLRTVAFLCCCLSTAENVSKLTFAICAGLNRLANRVLQHGAELSVADMHTMIKNWAPSPPNKLDELSPAAMELLAANQGKKTEMLSARLTVKFS